MLPLIFSLDLLLEQEAGLLQEVQVPPLIPCAEMKSNVRSCFNICEKDRPEIPTVLHPLNYKSNGRFYFPVGPSVHPKPEANPPLPPATLAGGGSQANNLISESPVSPPRVRHRLTDKERFLYAVIDLTAEWRKPCALLTVESFLCRRGRIRAALEQLKNALQLPSAGPRTTLLYILQHIRRIF